MVVKAKERKFINLDEVKVGEIFRYEDIVYMKVRIEDDYICCPRCDEDIRINDINSDTYGVDLCSGLIYEFNYYTDVEIIQGSFIEE